VFLKLILTT